MYSSGGITQTSDIPFFFFTGESEITFLPTYRLCRHIPDYKYDWKKIKKTGVSFTSKKPKIQIITNLLIYLLTTASNTNSIVEIHLRRFITYNITTNFCQNSYSNVLINLMHYFKRQDLKQEKKKEGNILFNDARNTFYLRLYGVKTYGKGPLR